MPINFSRKLTGRERAGDANRHLGMVLAFVAGAINAGGFLAIGQYTSHMTGIVSSVADNIALGAYDLVSVGLLALLSFMAGAACSAIMVNYARRHAMHGQYALPLILEASLLLCFGMVGGTLAGMDRLFIPATMMLLCFIMGLQNALVTKLSNAEVRTTHITGIVTDLGIELGKLFYWNARHIEGHPKVDADLKRLKLLAALAILFLAGGVSGALGFKYIGYRATLPLALALIALASVPVVDDLMLLVRKVRRQ